MDPTVARRNVTVEVQDQREGSSLRSVHSQLWTETHKQRLPRLRRRPRTHAHPQKPRSKSRSTSDAITLLSVPRCPAAGSLWSRALDDVVKKLHGLHDVFILEGDEEFRSVGISSLPEQACLTETNEQHTQHRGDKECQCFRVNELFTHTDQNKLDQETHLLFHLHLCSPTRIRSGITISGQYQVTRCVHETTSLFVCFFECLLYLNAFKLK